jgi:hypothetical protein
VSSERKELNARAQREQRRKKNITQRREEAKKLLLNFFCFFAVLAFLRYAVQGSGLKSDISNNIPTEI